MNIVRITPVLVFSLSLSSAWAGSEALDGYTMITTLDGEWILSPSDKQEGGATKKGPAAEIIGTDKTAISFKVIGKGSTVQENLLPGTGKEMATMYHCNDFKNCTQVQAKHYCAKQNQPELFLDAVQTGDDVIVMVCNMNTSVCNSADEHVHMIKHELSDHRSHLKTTYTIYNNGEFQKDSTYHFDRKQ